jgi:hypothetical protein
MTPASQRAKYVIDKVKSELTPIWLGVRQRMMLEREIAIAIQDAQQDFINTHAAALLERERAVWEAVIAVLEHDPDNLFDWTDGQRKWADTLMTYFAKRAQAKDGG